MLWIRLGDADDYHNEGDDLADVAKRLAMVGVERIEQFVKYGVQATSFEHRNYISLFWGDDEAQPSRELTAFEIRYINHRLRRGAAA